MEGAVGSNLRCAVQIRLNFLTERPETYGDHVQKNGAGLLAPEPDAQKQRSTSQKSKEEKQKQRSSTTLDTNHSTEMARRNHPGIWKSTAAYMTTLDMRSIIWNSEI